MAASDDDTIYRCKLRRAGFHPLPLSGKRPAMDKWSQKMNVTYDEIRLWQSLYPWSENTGILTVNTPTIDIDILDQEAAEAVEGLAREMFEEKGRILVRTGKAPKRAIPLRTNDPFKKLTTNLQGPHGKSDSKIEILCDGQQVVVHGPHPDTNKSYSWFGGEIGDVPRNDLPYIHREEAEDFLGRASELLVHKFGFSHPLQRETSKNNGAGEFHHADWSALFSDIIGGTNLHDSIRDLAASFVASNIAQDTAARILQSLMLASPIPHTDPRWIERFEDITRAILSACEKFARGEKPVTLKFIDMRPWDAIRAPARLWAVHDRIPARQPTLLSGEGSIGKTILELQLCVAHVLGRDWIGALPEQGPAIYFGAEDDADELHRRLEAIAASYGATFKNLIDHGLHLLSFAGEDCLLGVPNRGGQIVGTKLYDILLEAVQDIKPKHIGIDTSADVFGGNEIDRGQVRQFLSLLRKLAIVCNGSAVLLGHPSLEGIKSGTGISGSTGWHNSVRARMYFKAISDDSISDLRELEFKKNNYGPVAHSIKLQYHEGIFRPIQAVSPLEKAVLEQRAEQIFMATFRMLIAQNRDDLGPSPHAANYAPKIISDLVAGKEIGLFQKDYADAMERLISRNEIHFAKVGPRSKTRKLLRLGPLQPDQEPMI
jgi:RecA-family ATPase